MDLGYGYVVIRVSLLVIERMENYMDMVITRIQTAVSNTIVNGTSENDMDTGSNSG